MPPAPRDPGFEARARASRTLTVCSGELRARQAGGEVLAALMQATMMSIRDREGMSD